MVLYDKNYLSHYKDLHKMPAVLYIQREEELQPKGKGIYF